MRRRALWLVCGVVALGLVLLLAFLMAIPSYQPYTQRAKQMRDGRARERGLQKPPPLTGTPGRAERGGTSP